MKNRSSLFYLLRLFSGIFAVTFLALIYWSSLIQESKLQKIDDSIESIQKEISHLKFSKSGSVPLVQKEIKLKPRPHIDPSLPNLLQKDPYFTKTLPEQLGPHFSPKGIFRMATIGSPHDLHPFSQWQQVAEWTNYCQGGIASQKFGFYEVLAQDFALKMELRNTDRPDRISFWVHLREGLLWQPLEQRHFPSDVALAPHFLQKHPVTAADFKFFWDALSNPHVDVPDAVTLRLLLRDIDNVEVIDDLTFVVTCKLTSHLDANNKPLMSLPYAVPFYVAQLRPLARFVYQYNSDGTKICPEDGKSDFYRISSTWAQRFATHFASRVIVSCGPWLFDGIDDTEIRFKRNPDHYLPSQALYEGLEVYFLETPDAVFRDFVSQEIDLCVLTPQNLLDLNRYLDSPEYKHKKASGKEVRRLDFLQRNYAYVGWNEKNPLFMNKKVRQALTLAIDRTRLIRQNLNGKGIEVTGPFFYGSGEYNPALMPLPYDPERAKLLLAEEGWFDSVGDGVLHKEIQGKDLPFRFSLTYYVKNPITKANCELIAQFLKEVNIDCRLNGVDIADLSQSFEDKTFDSLYLSWSIASPPEDPRQLWHSEGADVKGSSNMIGFRNVEVDRLIEKLQFETDPENRKKLSWRLHEVIYDEQPYTFLFSPTATLVWWTDIHNILIPKNRQDLVPGANVEQPSIMYSWKE